MPRLADLPEVQRNGLLTGPVPVNDGAPFTPLARPLSQCTLAVVTTAALHLRDDRPFSPGDTTCRIIPASAAPSDIIQSHTSIGFDRAAQARDINVVFPIDRLRELVERGELGGIAENHYSLLGAQQDSTRPATVSGAELAERLLGEADVVLLTPT